MRIGAYLIVGVGEADRYLEQVLKQLHWVDIICVLINNVDEKTRKMVCKYADIVEEDNREWGVHQFRLKQDFVKKIGHNAEWWWCLDSDELFPTFTRDEAERMASGHDISYDFWCLQLWNDEEHVRVDLSFPNVRFYQYKPEFGVHFKAAPLHCGLAPMYAYKYASHSQHYFKHYGLMRYEDRKRKVARYDTYDPQEKWKGKDWYAALRNEKARSEPIADVIARLPETIRKKKEVTNNMKKKVVFMFRNKWGKPVEAVGEKHREQFIKKGFQEIQSITIQTGAEAPVIHDATEQVGEVLESTPPASTPPKRKRGRPAKGSTKGTL